MIPRHPDPSGFLAVPSIAGRWVVTGCGVLVMAGPGLAVEGNHGLVAGGGSATGGTLVMIGALDPWAGASQAGAPGGLALVPGSGADHLGAIPLAPRNLGLPTISVAGDPLWQATVGTWSDPQALDLRFSYRWQRSPDDAVWSDVAGATEASFNRTTAGAGERIRVVVVASNGSTTTAATSSGVVIPAGSGSTDPITSGGSDGGGGGCGSGGGLALIGLLAFFQLSGRKRTAPITPA